MNVTLGNPNVLGAVWDGKGVNFAVYSIDATCVDLCLFNGPDDNEPSHTIALPGSTHEIWHGYIEGIQPGQLYGYRAKGPYEPDIGQRFNHYKLLIDPYAKAITGPLKWDDALFGYEMGSPEEDMSFSTTGSAPFMPKSIVVDDHFDWSGENRPFHFYNESIIYEAHVKSLTFLHPDIPENIRGKYAALAHPVMLQYLKDLGITAIELMPVQYFISDKLLEEKGLTNYWGYNTIGFFAPDIRYSSSGVLGEQVKEFKTMVKALHQAGIEVLLDVVYNHTAEGNHMGPTLSFKSLGNATYYRLTKEKRYYNDVTGTGNTLNANHPPVLRLFMDSMRYWMEQMHVDGFRFDMAPALIRETDGPDSLSAFLSIIYQDPVISQAKLIAEPWDIGKGGFQLGGFPAGTGWGEWNAKYRDTVRDFWRGEQNKLADFATRLTGSSDLYEKYRRPTASINFITAHDGFTLEDLVSYNEKHNEANGEENKDGESNNRSCNWGAEGLTQDSAIISLRNQIKRNLLTTLFLSQGVPMLLSGDETGKTQQGNNNTYCQDNETSWINWSTADQKLLEFVKKIIHLRKSHPVFQRRSWFKGENSPEGDLRDIEWFLKDGSKLKEEQWKEGNLQTLGVFLNGELINIKDEKGNPIVDDNFYIIFNASAEQQDFIVPSVLDARNWTVLLDTSGEVQQEKTIEANQAVPAKARSIVLLQHSRM
jgi:isoamylase